MLYFVGLMVRMAIRPACIFFLLLLCLPCLAQTDSLYTDTVIIVQPPLVIKKQVHVSVTDYIKEESSIELGAYYSVNWNQSPTSFTTNGAFQSTGIQARYNLGQFQAGLGIGILHTSVNYQQEYTTSSEIVIRVDTTFKVLDCYWVVENGQLTYRCAGDTIFNPIKQTITTKHEIKQKESLQYLQLPISLSYVLTKGNYSLAPCLQAIYHKRTTPSNDLWRWEESMWMIGTEVRLGYLFKTHLLAEVKVEYKKNLTTLNASEENRQNWNLLGLGLGIYYRF